MLTYYVVAQMGQKKQIFFAIDYMLESIQFIYDLLFKSLNLYPIDGSGSLNLLLNNQNGHKKIQSAGNYQGSSETIRQLSKYSLSFYMSPKKISVVHRQYHHGALSKVQDLEKFRAWFAGVVDGDGNFDLRKHSMMERGLVLKSIRIKLHRRDLRILTRIQNMLHFGQIKSDKNKPYVIYTISKKEQMKDVLQLLNGHIRLKKDAFIKALDYFNVEYIESNYTLKPLDPYFSGLIDTDGSIVFNYNSNRIECNLELKYNDYTKKLNLEYVIPGCKPSIYLRHKKNQSPGHLFKSISFKYQTVQSMGPLYDYFMQNRLYCDMKFYRISKIKEFLKIRSYQKYPKNSPEFQTYAQFLRAWIQYLNPQWEKVPFLSKLT